MSTHSQSGSEPRRCRPVPQVSGAAVAPLAQTGEVNTTSAIGPPTGPPPVAGPVGVMLARMPLPSKVIVPLAMTAGAGATGAGTTSLPGTVTSYDQAPGPVFV